MIRTGATQSRQSLIVKVSVIGQSKPTVARLGESIDCLGQFLGPLMDEEASRTIGSVIRRINFLADRAKARDIDYPELQDQLTDLRAMVDILCEQLS